MQYFFFLFLRTGALYGNYSPQFLLSPYTSPHRTATPGFSLPSLRTRSQSVRRLPSPAPVLSVHFPSPYGNSRLQLALSPYKIVICTETEAPSSCSLRTLPLTAVRGLLPAGSSPLIQPESRNGPPLFPDVRIGNPYIFFTEDGIFALRLLFFVILQGFHDDAG